MLVEYNGTDVDVVIPSERGITAIADGVFRDMYLIESVSVPEGVTSIGAEAFSGCSAIGSIRLPASLTAVGDRAFAGWSYVGSIHLPENIAQLGEDVFKNSTIWNLYVSAGTPTAAISAQRSFRSPSDTRGIWYLNSLRMKTERLISRSEIKLFLLLIFPVR